MTLRCNQAIQKLQLWMIEEHEQLEKFLKDAQVENDLLQNTEGRILDRIEEVARQSATISAEINQARQDRIPILQKQRVALLSQLNDLAQPRGRQSLKLIQGAKEHVGLAESQLKEWERLLTYFNGEILPLFRDCRSVVNDAGCVETLKQCQSTTQAFELEVDRFRKQVGSIQRTLTREQENAERLNREVEDLTHELNILTQENKRCKSELSKRSTALGEECPTTNPTLEAAQATLLAEAKDSLSKIGNLDEKSALEFIQQSIDDATERVKSQVDKAEEEAKAEERKQYLLRQEIQDRLSQRVLELLPQVVQDDPDLKVSEVVERLDELIQQGVETVIADLRDILQPSTAA